MIQFTKKNLILAMRKELRSRDYPCSIPSLNKFINSMPKHEKENAIWWQHDTSAIDQLVKNYINSAT